MLTKAQIKTEEMNAKIKEMAGTSMAANFSMDGAAPPMVETEEQDEASSAFFLGHQPRPAAPSHIVPCPLPRRNRAVSVAR